jgi:hypothetical protein
MHVHVEVQYWRISQSSPSTLSPSIRDPGETADLQYTVNNLVPETLYIRLRLKFDYHAIIVQPVTLAVGDLGSNETTFQCTMLW